LTQRFVDRRTRALMKGLRAKEELAADIADDGAIHVESHFVGRLKGFRFIPDTSSQADGIHGKAARSAAARAPCENGAARAACNTVSPAPAQICLTTSSTTDQARPALR
jgi:ATP-dependent RNA helicase SUPV3L1/SUV3